MSERNRRLYQRGAKNYKKKARGSPIHKGVKRICKQGLTRMGRCFRKARSSRRTVYQHRR